jgi:hypothetical protein
MCMRERDEMNTSHTPPYYTTLHYTTLHCTTLHYTALHYTALHCTTLHYTTLHYTPARNGSLLQHHHAWTESTTRGDAALFLLALVLFMRGRGHVGV